MNLYLVVSEALTTIVWEDWFNNCGYYEGYRIAELIVARNYGQAKWLAWESDKDGSYPGDVCEMPKFAVRLKRRDVGGEARIASDEFDNGCDDELPLWTLGNAPHIGIMEEMTA